LFIKHVEDSVLSKSLLKMCNITVFREEISLFQYSFKKNLDKG